MSERILATTRATPGDPWWEYSLLSALSCHDVKRLTQLVLLAEANDAVKVQHA